MIVLLKIVVNIFAIFEWKHDYNNVFKVAKLKES